MSLPGSELITPEQGEPFRSLGLVTGTLLDGGDDAADNDNRRTHFRNPVEISRPIAVRLAPGGQEFNDPWRSATILDLSSGGLCLFLLAEETFVPQELLVLDLTNQPGFDGLIEPLPKLV
jgi:hypothetical protein